MKIKLFFALAIASVAASAQVTLEHTYVSECFQSEQRNYAFFTDNGLNFFTINESENKVLLYNASHILYKTVTINPGAGFSIDQIQLATDKLFNSNSKIEFIVSSHNYDLPNDQTKLTLFDEDGVNLHEFGNRSTALVIKVSDNVFKLLVSEDTSGSNTYDIYGLSGSLSVQQQDNLSSKLTAYPNPTSNRINISNPGFGKENGTLQVFTISGVKVLEQSASSAEKTISIDAANLAKGVYLYKINGYSSKFIKE